ncbi:MAG: PIN domain-containing protein [Nitrospirales bacterium]|nr:PIN domain-containing protein [Nitrospira sp.]MDR4501557.1 PIN domain-containing protein [Nitrospirales bacterium]
MIEPKSFVDTNVLVYAHDKTAGRKRGAAREIPLNQWDSETGVFSTQVFQEVFVSLTQKIPAPIDKKKARAIIEDLCVWEVVVTDEQAVLAAIDLQAKHRLSFWDSLIIEAACRSGAQALYSEDLSHGQHVGNLTIVNPFFTG